MRGGGGKEGGGRSYHIPSEMVTVKLWFTTLPTRFETAALVLEAIKG